MKLAPLFGSHSGRHHADREISRIPADAEEIAVSTSWPIRALVYLIATVMAISLPASFFFSSYHFELRTLKTNARINAALITQRIGLTEGKIPLARLPLDDIIEDDAASDDPPEFRQVFDRHRQLVAQNGAGPPSWPSIRYEMPINLSHEVAGYYKVDRSLRTLASETLIVALIGIALGIVASAALHALQLRRDRMRLSYLANYDPLTGLPNRLLFFDRLKGAIARAERSKRMFGLLFLDLDGFKAINDTFGHHHGDKVLTAAAERLALAVRTSDTVARLAGDEFTVLIEQVQRTEDLAAIAKSLLRNFEQPFEIAGESIYLTCSIGIAVYPNDARDAASLMRLSDMAMYSVKEAERNNYQFYTASLDTHVEERLMLEQSLRQAFNRREFVVHYQPQFDLASGRCIGMEALLRWQRPHTGLIPPSQFIDVLEKTGLIVPVGEWLLHEACAQAQAWRLAGMPPLVLSVNVSARQFRGASMEQTVRKALAETGFPAAQLQIELTESILMRDAESSLSTLRELRSMGIRIAVDDFGTGYSSLSYLRRFPLNALKVDQTFVRDMEADSDDASIVAAIIRLAHGLRLSVTAEGVETHAQLAMLREYGCNDVQGYLFSRPLAAPEFAKFIASMPSIQQATPTQTASVTIAST